MAHVPSVKAAIKKDFQGDWGDRRQVRLLALARSLPPAWLLTDTHASDAYSRSSSSSARSSTTTSSRPRWTPACSTTRSGSSGSAS
jgi:hypothetical protein